MFTTGLEDKTFKASRRPKSKATTRQGLTSGGINKAKFKVKVERQADMKSVIHCKNNQKLKLSSIV